MINLLKEFSNNLEKFFREDTVHTELCKICKKSVRNNDFSAQFEDNGEDNRNSRCLYCNKNFIKAREAIK
ncbi:MAG: hypothetical protein ACRC6A_04045 [Fusobacteriaceae bacterium]